MFNHIYNSDFVDVIKNIEDIDLILTDIPYSISRDNNFKSINRTGFDFGDWDKKFNISCLEHLIQCVKPGGSFVIFSSFTQIAALEILMLYNNILVKDRLIFQKRNPQPRNINRRYVPDIEAIGWYVKPGAKWTFNKKELEKYCRSVMQYPIPTKLKKYHPNAKPIGLLKELVERHSNPGDVVLDCFAGAMTTAVAAAETGRQFICIEKEKEYYDKAKMLLNQFGVAYCEK